MSLNHASKLAVICREDQAAWLGIWRTRHAAVSAAYVEDEIINPVSQAEQREIKAIEPIARF